MIKRSHEFFNTIEPERIYEKISRPVILADQFRTPENIGAVLRLAGNIGALFTYFINEEPRPFKKYKINKIASGAAEKVNWAFVPKNEIIHRIPKDYLIVALETTTDSGNIFNFKFPDKVAFLVGNETMGIDDEIIKLAHEKVYIPIPGPISSFNVSHALSIGLFEWLRQMSNQ